MPPRNASLLTVPIALVGVAWSMSTTGARADIVWPAPTDCPRGTRAATTHAGPHCLPLSCGEGRPCPAGQSCGTERLCVVEREYTNRSGQHRDSVVRGSCQHGPCAEGSCRAQSVCVTSEDVGTRPTAAPAASELGSSPGSGASAAASADSEAPVLPADEAGPERPRSTPSGCGSRAATGAITGVVLAGLLGAIAYLLRRRGPKRPTDSQQ